MPLRYTAIVRRWTAGIVLALAVIMVMAVGGYYLVNSRSFQLAGHLVERIDTSDKVVALTLDDGPTTEAPDVLQILADVDVPATFYLNGRDLAARPDVGRAIAAAGHEIGNHTYSHRRMVFVSPETVAAEVERTDEEIRRTGYRGPITFRPGSIILLHVMYEGRAASRAAIPRIVDELRADGYRFVTVSDLITR